MSLSSITELSQADIDHVIGSGVDDSPFVLGFLAVAVLGIVFYLFPRQGEEDRWQKLKESALAAMEEEAWGDGDSFSF
ncbi:MAG: hypothetical protein KKE11_03505 [Gammaproteobacteria bacterium]|nr:hypothetical protein [Gammaproteobacteria bacterium]